MRQVATDEDLQALHRDGFGFIYNDFSGLGRGGGHYNVLHRASCNHVGRSKVSVGKFFFEELDEAETWLTATRGPEGINWKRCHCVGVAPAPSPRSTGTMMDAEPAQIPFRESEVESFVAEHLIRSGYEVSRQTRVASGIIDLVAVKEGRSLVVEVKGEDAGGYTSAQMNFLMAIGQIASRMTEDFDDFAVAIPATDHFERVLSKFEESSGFRKLGISLFLVKRDGALEVR